MLSVALSGLVLIRNFFEETFFYQKPYISYISHLFSIENSELWKQYQSLCQEMMEQVCDLETVKPQETPIKVCVIFYNIEICYRGCGEKISFLAII